jgi:LuxR family maltose regulon positive regulatory protein
MSTFTVHYIGSLEGCQDKDRFTVVGYEKRYGCRYLVSITMPLDVSPFDTVKRMKMCEVPWLDNLTRAGYSFPVEKKEPGIILLNKLQPPEIKTKTLRRRRLLDIISRTLDKKVILLCAGPGYGKTTLLSHFFSKAKLPIVYYHLEKADSDPSVFLTYLVVGIQKTFPEFGRKVGRLRHLFNQPHRYSEIIIGTFINEIVECITEDMCVILEDYHALQPSSAIDKALDFMFKHMPANLHFIITSRSKPDIYFSLLSARDEFVELTGQQLRFTKAEIRRLFNKTYSIPLKPRDLEWVEKYSEGWPVSLRLMIQSTTYLKGIKSSDHARTVISGYMQSQAGLFNYFAQEIYFQEKPVMRRFLVDCSLFEWLNPELFDAATRRRNSERLFAELARGNAFIISIPAHGYRLHNLFRDFLYSKFTDAMRKRAICMRAADYLLKKGEHDEALYFYSQARAYTKMVGTIKRIGGIYISQGRSSVLSDYIEQLPAKIRNRDPDLLITYARALTIMGRFVQSRRMLLKAKAIQQKKRGAKLKYADVLYALGGVSYTEGKFAAALRYYRQALKVCPRGSNLTRASILNSLGSLHTALGGRHLEKAVSFYEKALGIAQGRGYGDIEASILNNWAMSEWKMGNLNSAYAKLSKIAGVLAQHFSPGCGAGFYNASKLSMLLGHIEEGERILNLGLKTCEPYTDMWSLVSLWSGFGLLHLERGDLAKARQYVGKSLQAAKDLGVEKLIVMALNEMCMIDICSREYTEADKGMSSIWMLKKTRDDAESIAVCVTEAKLRTAQGKFERAEELLMQARTVAAEHRDTFQHFLTSIELSRVFHLTGKTGGSCEVLREAVNVSREKGYDYLLSKQLKDQPWMIRSIREHDIEQPYVKAIIKRSKLGIHWVEGFFFGVPRVYVDDRLVDDSVWPTMKTKKLFFYMLLRRDEKVSSDCLIDALWHEVSGRRGSDSLRKAVQYTRDIFRSMLGKEAELISAAKGYFQMAPGVSVCLDTDEFDAALKKVRDCEDSSGKMELLTKAVSLCDKDFATGWYDDWVDQLRRYYKGKREECLTIIADILFGRGEYSKVLETCKDLVVLNPLEERHHCRLMEALAHLGRYAEIAEHFAKLKDDLRRELKAVPRKETLELYEALVRTGSGH